MPQRPAIEAATFLATDLEGSTRLWSHEPNEMAAVSAVHDELVGGIFERFGGESVSRLWEGDSTFASFSSASAAIGAGLEIQRRVSELEVGGKPLRVRVAIHSADCGSDPVTMAGAELNRTLKMRSVAHGGQILLSHHAVIEAGAQIPEGATLDDLGWHRLAYGSDRVRLFQLVPPGSQERFPPLLTIESSPNNIGIQLTTFVGMVSARERIRSMLLDPSPMAITGMPGIGKSRIAREVSSEMLGMFPDGVWVIDAQDVDEPADLTVLLDPMIPTGGRGDAHVGPTLVIVDGEMDGISASDLAAHIPPHSQLILTSCFPEGVDPTRVVKLEPLQITPTDQGGVSEAACLFIDRAKERVPGSGIDDQATVIEEIVEIVGGVPLAIEFLATKVTAMSPTTIRDRLAIDGPMLWGGSRISDKPSPLRMAFDHAFGLVSADELAFLVAAASGETHEVGDVPHRLMQAGLVDAPYGEAVLPGLVMGYLRLEGGSAGSP